MGVWCRGEDDDVKGGVGEEGLDGAEVLEVWVVFWCGGCGLWVALQDGV